MNVGTIYGVLKNSVTMQYQQKVDNKHFIENIVTYVLSQLFNNLFKTLHNQACIEKSKTKIFFITYQYRKLPFIVSSYNTGWFKIVPNGRCLRINKNLYKVFLDKFTFEDDNDIISMNSDQKNYVFKLLRQSRKHLVSALWLDDTVDWQQL